MRDLLEAAGSGRNVYITELHSRFGKLGDAECDRLVLAVQPLEGDATRRFDLRLPRLDRLDDEERDFVEEYVQAEVYNILSALGGRKLTAYFDPRNEALAAVAARLPAAFGVGLPRAERRGYGRCVNVIDRMLSALAPGAGPFAMESGDLKDAPAPARIPERRSDAAALFRRCTEGLEGKAFLGIDVGGTDIKAVLADDGKVVDYKEYDWVPASFLRSRQLIDPICLITRLFQARLWIHRLAADDPRRPGLLALAARGLGRKAGDAEMEEALAAIGRGGFPGGAAPRFDGIGVSFPDVVVRNKIVGGEVSKTRGIRNNPAIDYESDFQKLTGLDSRLGEWVKPGGAVRIINDGPMAAFTAAVEMTASPRAGEAADGIFAHTLGTELGTGWVTADGSIPDIPLEVYNFVIDLGSRPERAYESDDARSLNNFNTSLPGTLQKYCSQGGVFRLAMKYFPGERPDLFAELAAKGFMERRDRGGTEGWYVPTEPIDMRKPFLEHMMTLPEREGDETDRKIWREVGESLAVTILETKRILDPAAGARYLFGRLVKNPACFALIEEGARRIDPTASLVVAGSGMANTPLMKELGDHPELSVAQFAQAIGAVYFANSR